MIFYFTDKTSRKIDWTNIIIYTSSNILYSIDTDEFRDFRNSGNYGSPLRNWEAQRLEIISLKQSSKSQTSKFYDSGKTILSLILYLVILG